MWVLVDQRPRARAEMTSLARAWIFESQNVFFSSISPIKRLNF
jgi:hypothetical protein